MNEITEEPTELSNYKRISLIQGFDGAYFEDDENGNLVYTKDVILAVEETIKRIEKNKFNSPISDYGEGYNIALNKALQIIKEQFCGVMSNSEQNQQEDETK